MKLIEYLGMRLLYGVGSVGSFEKGIRGKTVLFEQLSCLLKNKNCSINRYKLMKHNNYIIFVLLFQLLKLVLL